MTDAMPKSIPAGFIAVYYGDDSFVVPQAFYDLLVDVGVAKPLRYHSFMITGITEPRESARSGPYPEYEAT